jgi:hypothetical protein
VSDADCIEESSIAHCSFRISRAARQVLLPTAWFQPASGRRLRPVGGRKASEIDSGAPWMQHEDCRGLLAENVRKDRRKIGARIDIHVHH